MNNEQTRQRRDGNENITSLSLIVNVSMICRHALSAGFTQPVHLTRGRRSQGLHPTRGVEKHRAMSASNMCRQPHGTRLVISKTFDMFDL